jgi:hypothetical protein
MNSVCFKIDRATRGAGSCAGRAISTFVLRPSSLALLIRGSPVSPGVFQSGLHFADCYGGRVVVNRIDLFKTAEAFGNLFDAFQPLQGCLTDIISCHKKHSLAQIVLRSLQHGKSG